MDRYDYYRGRVAAKLQEWKTGVVTLTRDATVHVLDARVDGVTEAYLTDTTIKASDLMVIAAPTIVPRKTDIIHIDGRRHVVKKIEAVPAAGAAAVFHIIIGS